MGCQHEEVKQFAAQKPSFAALGLVCWNVSLLGPFTEAVRGDAGKEERRTHKRDLLYFQTSSEVMPVSDDASYNGNACPSNPEYDVMHL